MIDLVAHRERLEAARSPKPRPHPRVRIPPVLVGVLVLAGLAGLSALLYLGSQHSAAGNSDNATIVLEGQSMAHGQVLLQGWALSRDSFWTVDALFYLIAVLVSGVHASLVDIVPGIIAALVVATGVLLALDHATWRARITAGLVVLAILALPSPALSLFYLKGPYHIGTALWALLAFYGLRRRRFGWGWVAAVVIFGFGMLGDLQLAVFGMFAAVGAGLVAMARTRTLREGLPSVLVGPASIALGFAIRLSADAFGTFAVNQENPQATIRQMVVNIADIGRYAPGLLGLPTGPFLAPGMPSALSDLHGLAIAAIVVGVAWASWNALRASVVGSTQAMGVGRDAWHTEDLLAFAFFGDIGIFLRLDSPGMPPFSRYLSAAIIFGAILAARAVGRIAESSRHRLVGHATLACCAVLTAAFGLGYADSLRGPAAGVPTAGLIAFLEQHHLYRGLGDYWTSSVMTVQSNEQVVVRPVVDGPQGKVVRYERNSNVRWYGPHQQYQFLVYNATMPLINAAAAQATFGAPAHTYVLGGYRVLTYAHSIHVSIYGAGG